MIELLAKEKECILKFIIESYIDDGEPIGSNYLVDKYKMDCSPAKARYIMSDLEEQGYLLKTHTSSGRIPSPKGYQYYAKYLIPHDENSLRAKMKDIFARRRVSIDTTIQEAAKNISEAMNITLITSESNEDAVLKSIQLVPLNNSEGTIILVNSYGEVSSKTITLDHDKTSMNDLRIAIRIFKERLIDIPIIKLKETAEGLAPILSEAVKNYETLLESFVTNIFDFNIRNENTVYGKDKIILANDISRQDLTKILNLIENQSIWQTIEADIDEDQNIKIAIRKDHSTFITKKLNYDNRIKEIALVGSNRMDYEKGLSALQMLEDLIALKSKNNNKKEGN